MMLFLKIFFLVLFLFYCVLDRSKKKKKGFKYMYKFCFVFLIFWYDFMVLIKFGWFEWCCFFFYIGIYFVNY